MMSEEKSSKIAIIGAGGVGGYLAARICAAYPDASVVARKARGESIREHGLVLHSGYHGELAVRPVSVVSNVSELPPQDVIFVCVKGYSLDEVCSQMSGAVTKDTVIVPVMNGVNPGEYIRNRLGRGTVVDSVIYIVAFANPDYSITQQGKFASMRIGMRRDVNPEAVNRVYEILSKSGVSVKKADDIEAAIWKKYILNCAYNVMTAAYNRTIGELRDDPATAGQYEALIWEAYAVSQAKGAEIGREDAEKMIQSFYHEMNADATSSLQRDVWSEAEKNETEVFSGYIVREAKKLNVSVPVSERMYEKLNCIRPDGSIKNTKRR